MNKIVQNNLIEQTKDESLNLIRDLITEKGFVASSLDIDNYKRVFSRDGIIAGLSILNFEDESLTKAFKQTLITLRNHQDHTGRIPSNVAIDGEKVSYGTTVGRVDATLWYVIGVCKFYLHTEDKDFLAEFEESIKKSLYYLDCLELNGRGLLYIPPGGDWADEYINEGYVLFDQVLYLFAIKYSEKVFKKPQLSTDYENLKNLILINYFPKKENLDNKYVYQNKLFEKSLLEYKPPMPIASFSAFGANQYDDLFAVSLLLESEILEDSYVRELIDYLTEKHASNFPIYPAFNPVITEFDKDWEKLNNNYIFRFKNAPYEYHNGGCWSVVHGFYLNSKNQVTEEEMEKFAEVLKKDEYVFPEFYHGKSYEPMGTHKLGFTAAGYLLAYDRYKNNRRILN